MDPLGVPTSDDPAAALGFGAVQMFVARATAADPKFSFDAHNAREVIDICRRLDGIPLAIEFAAAGVSLFGAFALRQRLDERMKLLAGGTPEQRCLAIRRFRPPCSRAPSTI